MTHYGWVLTAGGAALLLGSELLFSPAPRLLWNASASVPIGLYAVHPASPLRAGELLVVMPPAALATFLDERHYLPKGVPLVKHVAALAGQTVCRIGRTLTIDGNTVGAALDRDHLGRLLPIWQGCRVIASGQIFLMNPRSVASLDGRYFGPLSTTTIAGQADPIWIEEAP